MSVILCLEDPASCCLQSDICIPCLSTQPWRPFMKACHVIAFKWSQNDRFFKPLCFICLKNVSYGYIKCTCFSHTFKRCLSDKVQFIMFYNKQSNAKTSNVYKIVGTKCIQVSGRKHSNITTMHPTFDKKRNRQQISSWRGGERQFLSNSFF